ncbi:hypothetical protein LY76DRAFT_109016 [Colletotrichum caudatum]|nr:hypothetical protein LY76DRAFT_109016 [Colletotrichum caudatum]
MHSFLWSATASVMQGVVPTPSITQRTVGSVWRGSPEGEENCKILDISSALDLRVVQPVKNVKNAKAPWCSGIVRMSVLNILGPIDIAGRRQSFQSHDFDVEVPNADALLVFHVMAGLADMSRRHARCFVGRSLQIAHVDSEVASCSQSVDYRTIVSAGFAPELSCMTKPIRGENSE